MPVPLYANSAADRTVLLAQLGISAVFDLAQMVGPAARFRYEAGRIIMREGHLGVALFAVLEGRVAIRIGDSVVEKVGTGGIFGEMSLVDESPPSATVVVAEPTNVLHIDRLKLTAKLDADPAFAARFYRAIAMFLSVRMRSTVQRLGYGKATVASEDEIDMALLDTVTVAGSRFDRMVKRLMTA